MEPPTIILSELPAREWEEMNGDIPVAVTEDLAGVPLNA
jgi:hypothetical protein